MKWLIYKFHLKLIKCRINKLNYSLEIDKEIIFVKKKKKKKRKHRNKKSERKGKLDEEVHTLVYHLFLSMFD